MDLATCEYCGLHIGYLAGKWVAWNGPGYVAGSDVCDDRPPYPHGPSCLAPVQAPLPDLTDVVAVSRWLAAD